MQGCRVVETKSCFWYSPRLLVLMSIPYHRAITPSRGELGRLLFGAPAAAVRYHDPVGRDGGLFICANRDYDLPSLQGKSRNQTRRGLEQCRVEQLNFADVAEVGSALNQQTFVRQGRDPNTIPAKQWRRYCDAASKLPDFEAWGAFVNGELVAFVIAALVEDHYSILQQSSATKHLRSYPNNALIFAVTQRKLKCPGVNCVSYGLRSLDTTTGLDHFKSSMGFALTPFGESVAFHPLLKPLFGRTGRELIRWLAGRYPENDLWRKASAVLERSSGQPASGACREPQAWPIPPELDL